MAPIHYQNQRWLDYRLIHASLGLNELMPAISPSKRAKHIWRPRRIMTENQTSLYFNTCQLLSLSVCCRLAVEKGNYALNRPVPNHDKAQTLREVYYTCCIRAVNQDTNIHFVWTQSISQQIWTRFAVSCVLWLSNDLFYLNPSSLFKWYWGTEATLMNMGK